MALSPCPDCGQQPDPAYLPPELQSDLCPVCDLADLMAAIERHMAKDWRRQHPIMPPPTERERPEAALLALAREQTSWLG